MIHSHQIPIYDLFLLYCCTSIAEGRFGKAEKPEKHAGKCRLDNSSVGIKWYDVDLTK